MWRRPFPASKTASAFGFANDASAKKNPGAPRWDAAGIVGSVPVEELLRVAAGALAVRKGPRCDARHTAGNICRRGRAMRTRPNEMGAGIAANPHYPVLHLALRLRFIPVRWSCDQRPAKRCVAARAGAIRRRFGRPPFGGRPHLERPSSSRPDICRNSRPPSDGLLSIPDRVRVNSWESQRSVIEPSVNFLAVPVRSRPAGLATTLSVPAARRLCRPMIGSCHERAGAPTKKAHRTAFACG